MLQHLTKLGVNIPGGFVITVNAYQEFIRHNNLDEKIRDLVKQIDYTSVESLRRAGLQIRNVIRNGRFPSGLSQEIIDCYYDLSKKYDQEGTDVAVRSSATAEDLPDASFAGQQETYLNVRGRTLLAACRRCFASLFTDRATSYREAKGFNHLKVALSLGVQQTVPSDLAGAGVM